MAKLAKRTTVISGRGRKRGSGAGPFHLPQKPGRVNYLLARGQAAWRKQQAGQTAVRLAPQQRKPEPPEFVTRALDRLRVKRAA